MSSLLERTRWKSNSSIASVMDLQWFFYRNFANNLFVTSLKEQQLSEQLAQCEKIAEKLFSPILYKWSLADKKLRRELRSLRMLAQFSRPWPSPVFKSFMQCGSGSMYVLSQELEHLRFGVEWDGLVKPELGKVKLFELIEILRSGPWAWHPRFGWLCSDPGNTGCGFRCRALVHCPALVLSGRWQKAGNALQAMGISVDPRPWLNMNGSETPFFELHSTATLGNTEMEVYTKFYHNLEALDQWEKVSLTELNHKYVDQLKARWQRLQPMLREASPPDKDVWIQALSSRYMAAQLGWESEFSKESLLQHLDSEEHFTFA